MKTPARYGAFYSVRYLAHTVKFTQNVGRCRCTGQGYLCIALTIFIPRLVILSGLINFLSPLVTMTTVAWGTLCYMTFKLSKHTFLRYLLAFSTINHLPSAIIKRATGVFRQTMVQLSPG